MRRLILFLVFLVIALGGTTYYFYNNSKLSKIDKNLSDQEEVKTLVAKVDKLIVLPLGEVPTIATVTDLQSLKGQTFFVDAKIGDKVLIYNKAKKAILYSPTANKIVNVAPINIGDQRATTPTTEVIAPTPITTPSADRKGL
jgi:hypothetical protein